MNEVKIYVPDGCELIKDGDTYIVKEKKQEPPRSWKEFCKNFPVQPEECYIYIDSSIETADSLDKPRIENRDRNLCINREEAEAFLALMQLRQLRKAWVGDWEQPSSATKTAAILYSANKHEVRVYFANFWASNILSFPTEEMAQEFFECFRDLCEQAKIVL